MKKNSNEELPSQIIRKMSPALTESTQDYNFQKFSPLMENKFNRNNQFIKISNPNFVSCKSSNNLRKEDQETFNSSR